MATRRRSIQSTDVEASQVKSFPTITAGLRSTFDRLPYGCLLFMYRLDLKFEKGSVESTHKFAERPPRPPHTTTQDAHA